MKHANRKSSPPKEGSCAEKLRHDADRRRLLAVMAATGGSLLLPGFNSAVAQELMARGQRSDRRCKIRKGTLLQPQNVAPCASALQHGQWSESCGQIVKP